MAQTAQEAVDNLRIKLGETDKENSRWQDTPHLLYYYNKGRREFAKKSKALKRVFEQTTAIGATAGNTVARYLLDPSVFDIDTVRWDGITVDPAETHSWDEQTVESSPDSEILKDRPRYYRLVGDSVELWPAPDKKKTLEVTASVITTDIVLITAPDNEINPDQCEIALEYASYDALNDDDRDGTSYLAKFKDGIKEYNKVKNKKAPRYVQQVNKGVRWHR